MREVLHSVTATTLEELRTKLMGLVDFVWIVSAYRAVEATTAVVCGDSTGVVLSVVVRTLSDNSEVFDLEITPLDTRVPAAQASMPKQWT